MLIRLGDTDVDYSEDFKFYITSTLANPHYAPEVCIKVTIVNFTVTFEGLEDQLLADVATLERPDLEAKKEDSVCVLVVSIAEGRKTIQELEDKILKPARRVQGQHPRRRAADQHARRLEEDLKKTEESVKGAEATTKEIDVAREAYRPVATRGSILYFVVADFASVDPMYQFSLAYFKEVLRTTVNGRPNRTTSTRACDLLDRGRALDLRDDLPRTLREAQDALRLHDRRLRAAPARRNLAAVSGPSSSSRSPPTTTCRRSARRRLARAKTCGPLCSNADARGASLSRGCATRSRRTRAAWQAYFESDAPQNEPSCPARGRAR